MQWFEALVLGIVQGLTEYLPVSSSGHLAIGAHLFGLSGEENLTFTVAVRPQHHRRLLATNPRHTRRPLSMVQIPLL